MFVGVPYGRRLMASRHLKILGSPYPGRAAHRKFAPSYTALIAQVDAPKRGPYKGDPTLKYPLRNGLRRPFDPFTSPP